MQPKFDFEWNMLGIYNYTRPGKFEHLFSWLKENHDKIPGDIIESGVFRGSSTLSVALFLREIGSNKTVYGFDSFSGFPPVYHKHDDPMYFEELYKTNGIHKGHYEQLKSSREIRNLLKRAATNDKMEKNVSGSNSANISTSLDFSDTSVSAINAKIKFLGLENVKLVPGNFAETMKSGALPESIMCAILDSDLYQSYVTTFEFVWPRLSPDGFIYLDEYYSLKFPGARVATDEFLANHHGRLVRLNPNDERDFERWGIIKHG